MRLVTRRTLGIAAALSLVGVLGYWVPWALDGMLLADALLVVAAWVDAQLAPRPVAEPRALAPGARPDDVAPPALAVRREAPPAFSLGHPGEVTYHWLNGARLRARLRVRELRPDILGGAQPVRRIEIPAHGSLRERVPVEPVRRGRETAGAFYLESVGPLGLGVRRIRIPVPWTVTVYPPLVTLRLRRSVAEARRHREAGRRPVRRLGEGRMFESLREWVPGDDVRHIDWKATARRRKVITRQYEAERRQQVLLVLDAGRLMTAEVGGVARMEYAVQAALELAYAATQYDDNVGVMVFADGVRHFVAPQRGRLGLKQVLDVLAVAVPTLVEPDYPGAFRYLAARNRKRALTVLFTDVIDRLASEALVANVTSLRPRHLPLAVTLRNPALDRVSTARPAAARDAYRKAAAEELLRAREEALGHMRRAGVLVLDVPPQRAAEAVVAQYGELKRRGVL
ncbi:MAG TPA: DUF58 domain-containing protein [Gemmatimonadales bacterium]|nr:DUF58 domain-containing protein [Gemmatimonadales bacterium]